MTSNANAYLLECLRAYPSRPPIDPTSLDATFWNLAEKKGVAVLVAHQLELRTDRARALAVAQAVSAMRCEAVTLQCLRICDEMGIDAVPLKGPLLGKRLYGDAGRRPTSDVDLLVAHADVKRLIKRLAAEGAVLPKAYVHDYYEKAHHHLNVTWRGTLIELHFRASSSFGVFTPSEPMLERSVLSTIDGQQLRTLECNDEIVYLATHAAAHFLALDVHLMDLKLAQRQRAMDWGVVGRRARALRLHHAIGAALVAAETRVGFNTSQMDRSWRDASQRLLAALPRELPPGYVDDWHVRVRQHEATVRLCDGPAIALRALGQAAWRATRRRFHDRWPALAPESWEV